MANTLIQIKRSTLTPQPDSLNVAELAYSYVSNVAFIGTSDGTGVLPIGGQFYVNRVNVANQIAISAFDRANNVATGANNFLLAVIAGANTAVGAGANAFASATIAGANTAVGAGANAFMIAVQNGSNTAIGAGANNYANSTFVRSVAAGQTITGNLAITGSLTVSGNAFSIDTNTLIVSDPLIYLAGNNFVSDIVDIGFVGSYAGANSQNLHTGVFRDATIKEYYVFDSYNQQPNPNHIDTSANGFSLAVLNAVIRTSNLILGGANAITTIASVGTAANAYAALIGSIANTNAANATYLSTGVVSVGVGGTGRTSFTNNGILFGNSSSTLRVTAAGTEGHVLQVSDQGTPFFGHLDGGTFN